MKKAILAVIFFCGGCVYANGSIIGNGGDVVYCPEEQTNKVQMLDFYEAETLRGWTIDLGPGQSYMEKVNYAFGRLVDHDYWRAKRLKKEAAQFMAKAKLIPNAKLRDVPDSHEAVLPENCELKQVAIRQVPEYDGDPTYLVDKDYWDQMDEVQRAGLILHEVIYGYVVDTDSKGGSTFARYFNGLLASGEKLAQMKKYQYDTLLSNAGIPYLDNFMVQEPRSGYWFYLDFIKEDLHTHLFYRDELNLDPSIYCRDSGGELADAEMLDNKSIEEYRWDIDQAIRMTKKPDSNNYSFFIGYDSHTGNGELYRFVGGGRIAPIRKDADERPHLEMFLPAVCMTKERP
jgi:hypothetical protein